MNLYLMSGRDNQVIKTNGMDAETVRESIFNAIKNLYLSRPVKSFILHVSESEATCTDTTSLVIGIGLTADATGKIRWENHLGFKKIALGYLPYKRYTQNAIWTIVDLIMNFFGVEDAIDRENEFNMESEMNAMFEYAAEAHENIENIVSDIMDYAGDISGDDIDDIVDDIDYIRDRFIDIENELSECLHRCDYLTGCDIHWDDFCGAGYFDDISKYILISDIADGLDSFDTFEYFIRDILRERDEDEIRAIMDKYFEKTGSWLYLAA